MRSLSVDNTCVWLWNHPTVLLLTSLITYLTSEIPFFTALRSSSKSLMSCLSFHEIPFKIDCRIQSNLDHEVFRESHDGWRTVRVRVDLMMVVGYDPRKVQCRWLMHDRSRTKGGPRWILTNIFAFFHSFITIHYIKEYEQNNGWRANNPPRKP